MTLRPATAIAAFERAVRDHEFKGAAHPAEWDDIEQRYQDARKRLLRYIERVAGTESSPLFTAPDDDWDGSPIDIGGGTIIRRVGD